MNTRELLAEAAAAPLTRTIRNRAMDTIMVREGEHDASDLIVTGPQELEDLISGTVLAINNNEWMALSQPLEGRRCWQSFRANKVATSEELYIRALRNPTSLICCHRGL